MNSTVLSIPSALSKFLCSFARLALLGERRIGRLRSREALINRLPGRQEMQIPERRGISKLTFYANGANSEDPWPCANVRQTLN